MYSCRPWFLSASLYWMIDILSRRLTGFGLSDLNVNPYTWQYKTILMTSASEDWNKGYMRRWPRKQFFLWFLCYFIENFEIEIMWFRSTFNKAHYVSQVVCDKAVREQRGDSPTPKYLLLPKQANHIPGTSPQYPLPGYLTPEISASCSCVTSIGLADWSRTNAAQ